MTRPASLADAVDLYLGWLASRNFAATTLGSYAQDLKRLRHYLEEVQQLDHACDVLREHLTSFQGWLHSEYRTAKDKPLAVGTQAHILAATKSFFRHLAAERMIGADPAASIVLPKRPQKLPSGLLSEEEIENLLDAPDVSRRLELRDRAILELFYGSGLRRSELLGLSVYDIDYDRDEVRVERGKGGKGRVVPIPPVVTHWIRRYVEEVRPKLAGPQSGDALFLGQRSRPLRSGWIVLLVRRYAKRAGIEKDPKCHGLRHTYGTHLLRRGMGIRQIQKLLGHRSITSTQIYTHLDPTDLVEDFHRAHPRSRNEP